MGRVRDRLTYANVISTLCLFMLLGGAAYAATQVPKNSVGTKQLKKNAVTGSKVKNGSLSAADIGGPVDSATNAGRAENATRAEHAANADLLDGLDSGAFQRTPKVRTEDPAITNDYTPDVSGLSALVLHNSVATVMGDPSGPIFTGGVDGQHLTIIATGNEVLIFVDQFDLKLANGTSWAGEKGDTLSLVLANGVWYETGRSKNH